MAAQPGAATAAVFADGLDYFAPSQNSFMVNFAVDDLDGMIARCRSRGPCIIGQTDDAYGRFAHVFDPEGNKLELWCLWLRRPPCDRQSRSESAGARHRQARVLRRSTSHCGPVCGIIHEVGPTQALPSSSTAV
jgi:hypothetical protein